MDINELEVLRKKARNIWIFGIIIAIIITAIIYFVFKINSITPIVFIATIVIVGIISIKPTRKFSLAYKDEFVKKALNNIFTDLVYNPEMGLNYSVIANTNMMDMGDRYTSNDYVSGKYKNINVEQADVHIEEERETTDSDGNTTTTWVTIFRGRWMVFDFNKTFKANIQVCQKGFGNARVNKWFSKNKLKKVELEDQDFNNKFRTYAHEQHDAFYVLTPSLMEKIKNVSSSINGKLLFCFVNNKLHIGIQNGKDSFEHSIWTKINEEKEKNKISLDIKLITNFVDQLSLDNDLFRKGV